MIAAELEWDEGNWPKCGKHGVSKEEIEEVFANNPLREPDPYHDERRLRAIEKTEAGRYVFVVYTERYYEEELRIRPLSARYMHNKEIKVYEQKIKALSCSSH